MSSASCALCGRPQIEAYRPFCSKRCADQDLRRWLVGAYVIPDEAGEAEAPGPADSDGHDED